MHSVFVVIVVRCVDWNFVYDVWVV